MNNVNDFVIENGVLKEYVGEGGDIVIPDGVSVIGKEAFRNCVNLTRVDIPNGVIAIEDYAFLYCDNLTEVSIADSVQTIGYSAFDSCKSLKKVILSKNLTEISSSAFARCTQLEAIEIPGSVVFIGSGVFEDCISLQSIEIPDNITKIYDSTFGNCKSLKKVILPKSLERIGGYAFLECEKIESIEIPGSVVTIGEASFKECVSLKSIAIPDSVTDIGYEAFNGCKGLLDERGLIVVNGVLYGIDSDAKHITVPADIKVIDGGAFRGTAVTELTLLATTLEIKTGSFSSPLAYDNKLEVINVPNELYLSSKIFPDGVWFCVSDSESFFKTADSRTAAFVGYDMTMTAEDLAYVWLFQSGKKWKDLAKNRTSKPGDVLQQFVEIYRKDATLPEPKTKIFKEFIEFFKGDMDAAEISSFLKGICIACPSVKKKLEKEAFYKEFINAKETVAHPIEALVDRCYENPTKYRDEISKAVKSGVPYADGSGNASRKAIIALIELYMPEWEKCSSITRGEFSERRDLTKSEKFKAPQYADEIVAALDREKLSAMLLSLVCGAQYRNYLLPFACWATDEDISAAIKDISWKKKGNSKERYWASNIIEALYLSDAPCVVAYMEKSSCYGLEKYLKMRGMTVQEYRDKYSLPKWNMDEKGSIVSAYGQLTYAIKEDFSLRAFDGEKELRSVTAKAYPEAAAEFKALKKEATDFYKKRAGYIRGIYITAEKITLQHWLETYFRNPVLKPVTEKVIWSDASKESFMLMDGKICTVEGNEYEPKEYIQIAHVLDMFAEKISAWQSYLKDSSRKLLIEQVWEPVAAVNNLDKLRNMVITKEERNEFKRVLERKGISLSSEADYSEFDYRMYKYVFSDTGKMYIGGCFRIDYRVNQETGETSLLEFHGYKENDILSRKMNSILYELGRICVGATIRKNDGQLLTDLLTDSLTAAQIMENIRIALEYNSTDAIGILLEYKQNRYPEFDPMAEFTLD